MSMATVTPVPTIYYPESDGKPMAETDIHRQIMVDMIEALSGYFRADPLVYVSGNLLLYYEEGNPRKSVAPDTFVAFGVPKRRRRTYKLWEEEQAPAVVFEITSASTREEDLGEKRELYATLGVREYFLFDPLEDYLQPSLQGYELVESAYLPLPAHAAGRLVSRTLRLRLEREGERLRLVDVATGAPLLWADEEAAARRALEAELAQLRAEVARLRSRSSSDEGSP